MFSNLLALVGNILHLFHQTNFYKSVERERENKFHDVDRLPFILQTDLF